MSPRIDRNLINDSKTRQNRVTKSYNFDSGAHQKFITQKPTEQYASNGNIIAYACGPLKKQRYINPKIEAELVDFKKEIEDKFEKSLLKKFVMPRVSADPHSLDDRDSPDALFSAAPLRQQRNSHNRQLAQSTEFNMNYIN